MNHKSKPYFKIATAFVLCLACFCLTSCKPSGKPSEGLKKYIELLMKKAYTISTLYESDYQVTTGKVFQFDGKKFNLKPDKQSEITLSEFGLLRDSYDPTYGEGYQFDFTKLHSVKELKTLTETAYTKEFADKNFYQRAFYSPSNNDPKFIESGGEVYVNLGIGGRGFLTGWKTETLKIKSQTADVLVVEMDVDLNEGMVENTKPFLEKHEIKLKKENGEWRINSEVY